MTERKKEIFVFVLKVDLGEQSPRGFVIVSLFIWLLGIVSWSKNKGHW